MNIVEKIDIYLNEMFGKKKPSKKDIELMGRVRSSFGLPDRLEFVDSEIISRTDGKEKWWVILVKLDKKYYGMNIDDKIFETSNKKQALKWIRDEKFGDLEG